MSIAYMQNSFLEDTTEEETEKYKGGESEKWRADY